MVHIYTNKKYIPTDKQFVSDPEAMQVFIKLNAEDAVIAFILDDIEQATISDPRTFKDRVGRYHDIKTLSTTSKILLLGHLSDYVIMSDEMGNNGLDILTDLDKGNFYFTNISERIPNFFSSVSVNNIVCNSFCEIADAIDRSV